MTETGLARAHGAPVLDARIRTAPEDFLVEEMPRFEPSGAGEHLLLTVEKRGMNTAFAAKRIAAWACVAESAIGFAGLKDRHAVTRAALRRVASEEGRAGIAALQADDLRVLEHGWHARKLRAVRWRETVSSWCCGTSRAIAPIDARLRRFRARGVPNSFGAQRFGREDGNVDKALGMFAGRRARREERSLLLSAARSALFDLVLDARVTAGSWDRGLEGEVWVLDGSRSVFGPEPISDELQAPAARAMPKSATSAWPCESSTFSGFTSRWISPCPWA